MSAARLHRLAGSGPTVLLIHGYGADRLTWLGTVAGLQGSAGLIAAELAGHGSAADDVGDGTPASLAGDLAVALAAEELDGPMLVVGHSLGAAVALHLAEIAPAAVRGLVLLAPAGLGQRLDAEFLTRYPRLTSPEEAAALLERLVTRKRMMSPVIGAHVLGGLDRPERRQALSIVADGVLSAPPPPYPPKVPVSLLWGEADEINPMPENAEERFGSALIRLPATGHLPHVEAAARVNAAILGAL